MRLNDKQNGRIVMQRLQEDDMIGHVSELTTFELLTFSAIAQKDEEQRNCPVRSWCRGLSG